MQQRSFLTQFMQDHLDKLDLSNLFAEYRAAEFTPDLFHLGIGEIADITNTATWHAIMQDFYSDPQLVAHTTMYAGTHGAQEANQAIAEHIGQRLGRPEFSDQNVLTYDGAHNAIHGVVRTCVMPLGSPYDERQYVLVPTPCYPYFPTILNLHSGVLAYVAYSADELVEGIETYANSQVGVILINTPNNPLGFALNRDHVERINRAVAPYDCVLAVDMVYALAANDPQAIRALAAFDPERTIYVDSFSKKFGLPGFRLGYVATANPELFRALSMMKASESIASSTVKALFGAHLLGITQPLPRLPQPRFRGATKPSAVHLRALKNTASRCRRRRAMRMRSIYHCFSIDSCSARNSRPTRSTPFVVNATASKWSRARVCIPPATCPVANSRWPLARSASHRLAPWFTPGFCHPATAVSTRLVWG